MFHKILIIVFVFCNILVFSNINIALAVDYNFEQHSGLDKTAEPAGYDVVNDSYINNKDAVINKIGTVVKAVLSFLGVIFLILMIYGGFLWMTAQGNEQEVEKAKNLITAAAIGLVIVVSAYAISYFVVKTLSDQAFP